MTDALRLICENTAKHVGGNYLKKRYAEMLAPQKEETRNSEEVIQHMKNVLGKLAVDE